MTTYRSPSRVDPPQYSRCCAFIPSTVPGETLMRCQAPVRAPRSRWCVWHGGHRDRAQLEMQPGDVVLALTHDTIYVEGE